MERVDRKRGRAEIQIRKGGRTGRSRFSNRLRHIGNAVESSINVWVDRWYSYIPVPWLSPSYIYLSIHLPGQSNVRCFPPLCLPAQHR